MVEGAVFFGRIPRLRRGSGSSGLRYRFGIGHLPRKHPTLLRTLCIPCALTPKASTSTANKAGVARPQAGRRGVSTSTEMAGCPQCAGPKVSYVLNACPSVSDRHYDNRHVSACGAFILVARVRLRLTLYLRALARKGYSGRRRRSAAQPQNGA